MDLSGEGGERNRLFVEVEPHAKRVDGMNDSPRDASTNTWSQHYDPVGSTFQTQTRNDFFTLLLLFSENFSRNGPPDTAMNIRWFLEKSKKM